MEPSSEIDLRLRELSDTEILLTFSRALGALYPHMKTVYAHCYEPYDDVVEALFHSLVFSTLSGKYGVPISQQSCHTYDSVGSNYERTNYIRVRPKVLPQIAQCGGSPFEVTDVFLAGKELVFKAFGDGSHNLAGGEVEDDVYEVTFALTEVEVFDPKQRAKFGDEVLLWFPNDAVEYQLVPNAISRPAA